MADSAEKSSGAEKKRGGKVHRMDGGLEEHFKVIIQHSKETKRRENMNSNILRGS